MEKDQIEITMTVSKTIQEKQFEPLAITLSATMMTNDEMVVSDYKDGMDLLEDLIKEKFNEKGIKW